MSNNFQQFQDEDEIDYESRSSSEHASQHAINKQEQTTNDSIASQDSYTKEQAQALANMEMNRINNIKSTLNSTSNDLNASHQLTSNPLDNDEYNHHHNNDDYYDDDSYNLENNRLDHQNNNDRRQHNNNSNSNSNNNNTNNISIDRSINPQLKETLDRLERGFKYILIQQIFLLILKISRIILVLGLLIKLFFELSCEKSSIHSLLICAFIRDIISGILDMQTIFKLYELRYKIRRQHYDDEVKEFGKYILKQKRESAQQNQLILGRFSQPNSINQIQQSAVYEMFELENSIGNLMPYIAHFQMILKYSYYLLFLISIIFIIRYDDEQFCHVFEKYTIIYLFLPIYFIFLIAAIFLTFFGVFVSIILITVLVFLVKYLQKKYQQQKQIQINELRANNLGFVLYKDIKDQLNNNSCAVCLNDYVDNAHVSVLKCSNQHHFHHDCLKKWILLKGSCPSCRSQKII